MVVESKFKLNDTTWLYHSNIIRQHTSRHIANIGRVEEVGAQHCYLATTLRPLHVFGQACWYVSN